MSQLVADSTPVSPISPRATNVWTLVDLAEKFGPLPASRIRPHPAPGTAVEQDVIDINDQENCLCELIDGVLVEKTVGFVDGYLATFLTYHLNAFVLPNNLGIVAGADAMIRLFPGMIRLPDACFIAWDRLPGRRLPAAPIADVVPDLAVEVLSRGNTPEEMDRKLHDYFTAGVRLVWYVDPPSRSVRVYRSVDDQRIVTDTLDGGDVLPGFQLKLTDLFENLDK
jgi:Uma2 family endonuclease